MLKKKNLSKLPNVAPEYDLMTLLEAGCHFGHQKAKRHPRMDEYIYAEKDGVHIFDLAITASQLQLAYNLVYDMASKGKSMVMVGTKRQARELIEEAAKDAGTFYIVSRWLGGFLTNWNQVKKSLKRMVTIEKGLLEGKFDGYTKFEKVQLDKEKNKLSRFFEGLRGLTNSPDFLFVVDINREKNAIAEAQIMGVPVIAIVDSNSDPTGVDVVIPANDDAVRSLSFLINEIAKAYKAGKQAKGKTAPTKKEAVKEEKKAEEKVEKSEKSEEKSEEKKPATKAKAKKAAPKKKPAAKKTTKKTTKK